MGIDTGETCGPAQQVSASEPLSPLGRPRQGLDPSGRMTRYPTRRRINSPANTRAANFDQRRGIGDGLRGSPTDPPPALASCLRRTAGTKGRSSFVPPRVIPMVDAPLPTTRVTLLARLRQHPTDQATWDAWPRWPLCPRPRQVKSPRKPPPERGREPAGRLVRAGHSRDGGDAADRPERSGRADAGERVVRARGDRIRVPAGAASGGDRGSEGTRRVSRPTTWHDQGPATTCSGTSRPRPHGTGDRRSLGSQPTNSLPIPSERDSRVSM